MNYELVKIINGKTLLNHLQIECPYSLEHGRRLAPGIHAVVWPEGSPGGRYDKSAFFYGPFKSWKDAATLIRKLSEDGYQRPSDRIVTVATVLSRWLDQGLRG